MSPEDPIPALNRALESRYRIERELGRGGMATVYLAEDVRHRRTVAVKVLNPELAAVVGGERFLTEIETTASLQHPNILPLFDSGEADGFLYYVMPSMDGESLRNRLERQGQLPVGEAVRVASEVAEALDYAHRQGVVHRDIKPGNILLKEGRPLVADFGIALALGVAGGGRLTHTGMSPEQAAGDPVVGPPSDIYSLGCVLFEMMTGEPPYQGSSAQAVLGKILSGEPVSVSGARRTVPAHIDAAIRRALERVPADRFVRAAEFAGALADTGFRHGPPVGGPAASVGPWKALALVMGLLAVVSTGLLVSMVWRPARPAPVILYEQTFAEEDAPILNWANIGVSFALSEDGSTMAYVGSQPDRQDEPQIWVRYRDQEAGMPIAGTEVGVQPFFSPDGRSVGFIDHRAFALRVVSLEGGPPLTLVGSGVQRSGAAWGGDGYVYYVGESRGLYRVPAQGGQGEEVAPPAPDARVYGYAWPDVLPGGRAVLVTVERAPSATGDDDIGVIDLESGRLEVLVGGALGRHLHTGHLVYVTGGGDLVAAPFDQDGLRITGPAVPLLSGLPQNTAGPDVALSPSGRLLYESRPQFRQELVWVDRSGEVTPVEPGWTFVPPPVTQQPTLSPGDRQIALSVVPDLGPQEIWVKQIDGTRSRLPFDGRAARPTWSPDGEDLVFLSDVLNNYDAWTRRADGTGEPELLVDMEDQIAQASWAPDESWLLIRTPANRGEIFGFSPSTDASPRQLIATEFFDIAPALSPDGRFLAYGSSALGGVDVLVRPYPSLEPVTKVSLEHGMAPVWSQSGEELFYVTFNPDGPRNEMVAARVDTGQAFRLLSQDTLFTIPPGINTGDPYIPSYDVTEDGQRFLMFRCVDLDGECQAADFRYRIIENFDQVVLARVGN